MRQVLTLGPDKLQPILAEMSENRGCGGVCAAGAAVGLDSLKAAGGQSPEAGAISGARTHTQWIDSVGMASILGESTFDLSELKTGNTSIFLVLPPKYLKEHGAFLRVFVRSALEVMMADLEGKRCLFLLDEFYSLGRVDQIITAVGQLPGYGVHLWPILQDLGQLLELYGPNGSHSFFGNSDAHIFFANSDAPTLDYISSRLGRITLKDIGVTPPAQAVNRLEHQRIYANSPPTPPAPGGPDAQPSQWAHAMYYSEIQARAETRSLIEIEDRELQRRDANAMRDYQHALAARGDPRLWPDEVKELVGKKDEDRVARSMIVFGKGGDVFNLRLAPYYEPISDELPTDEAIRIAELKNEIKEKYERIKVIKIAREKDMKNKAFSLSDAFTTAFLAAAGIGLVIAFTDNVIRVDIAVSLIGLLLASRYLISLYQVSRTEKNYNVVLNDRGRIITNAYADIIRHGGDLNDDDMKFYPELRDFFRDLKVDVLKEKTPSRTVQYG